MIIVVSGKPGSGKSTLAKNIAKKLGFKHYSTGDLWRQIAAKKGMTTFELNKAAEKDKSIDRELDKRTAELGRKEDNIVIDTRIAWHFIPKSLKIFVDIDMGVAAKRVFNDKRAEDKENTSIESTKKTLEKRTESERKRYKQLYGIEYLDAKNYDLVLNSSKTSKEELLENALGFVKQYLKKE